MRFPMATKAKTKRQRPDQVLTRTAEPPAATGRYRASWRRASECAHRWAANATPAGHAGNVRFRDGVILSYGSHFPVARHVLLPDGSRCVFFTTRGYSSSTASHKSDVRRAVPKDVPVFEVDDVLADTVKDHRANMEAARDAAERTLRRSFNARSRKVSLVREAVGIIDQANRYAAAVGLADRLDTLRGRTPDEWVEEAKAARAERREAEEKAAADRLRAEVRRWLVRVEEWRAGKDIRVGAVPDPKSPLRGRVFLRVTEGEPGKDGARAKYIETSLGLRLALRKVRPLLAVVRGGDVPAGFRVDDIWTVDELDRDRRLLRVGCHTVSFAEVERVAKQLGL
jgi:hypothetical protein